MIKNVLLDGVQINNESTFLSNVRDSISAQTDLQTYSRGGRSGVVLGTPFYRGFIISMEWTIIGRTYAELVEARDRLARLFRINPNKSVRQTKVLGFEMADDTVREVPVVFSPHVGSVSGTDTTKTVLQVTAHSELEYMTSNIEMVETFRPLNLGGFAVPFDVPFSLGNNPVGEPTVITNEGNSEFYPCIRLVAPLTTSTLINETVGKQIEFDGDLTNTDELILDFYERTAIKNGTVNVLGDITGDWWHLDPGTNIIRLVVGSGTGFAQIKYRHAYRGF